MENEGIMSLPTQEMPETDENLYLAAKEAAMQQSPEQTAQFSSAVQQGLGAEGMTVADAQQLLQLVDYIIANSANYPQVRQQLIEQGLADPEDLPEQFNAAFFSALKAGLLEFITSGAAPTMPMAQGGLASLGRFGDTQLAHINPQEAAMLRAMGGRGSINPRTGLPEYFSLKSLLKSAVRIVGTIALTAVGVPPPIAAAITTKVTGGSWKEALISGVTAGVGQVATPYISELIGGSLPTVLQPFASDVAQGIFATGVGLARGQSFGEALRGGLQSGVISAGVRAVGSPSERATRDAAFRQQLEQAGQKAPTVGSQAMAPATAPVTNVVTPSDVTAATPGAPVAPVAQSFPVRAPFTAAPFTAAPFTAAPSTAAPEGATVGSLAGGSNMPLAQVPGAEAPIEAGAGSMPSFSYAAPGQLGAMPPMSTMPAAAPIEQLGQSSAIPGQSATAGQPITGIDRLAGMVPGGPQTLNYLKGMMPGSIQEAGAAQAQKAGMEAVARLPAGSPDWLQKTTYDNAYKAAMPGVLKTYGPIAAAGIGLLGATGGFETKPINVPESAKITGATLLAQKPQLYGLLPPPGMAAGGIMRTMAAGGYPRRTGQISGPGTEKSDDIPAMLSDGEFVLTARAVRGAGGGSRREGAKRLYRLMHMLEKSAPARA